MEGDLIETDVGEDEVRADSWVFVSAYGPYGSEKTAEETEVFWDELRTSVQGFRASERVVVLGDLNARVGCCAIPGIIGNFGVNGVNANGEKMIEMCGECEMAVGNTFFKKRMIHKITWVSRIGGKGRISL